MPTRRFSLKQLLAWTSIAGLLLANLVLAYRLRRAEDELSLLRKESGYLVVNEPDKIQLIAAPALGRHQWRWRLHAPPGLRFEYGVQFGDVPAKGVPDSRFTQNLQLAASPSGTLLTLEAARDAEGQMHLAFRGADFGYFSPTDKPLDEWLNGSSLVHTAGTGGQETYEIGEPIILRRSRMMKSDDPLSVEKVAEYGYIVWLRAIKE